MAALAVLWGLLAAALRSAAEPCPEPTIVPSYYTTSDAVISSESVFVVEISLACKNGAQNVALYADVNGKQFPVTRGQDVGRYQVRGSRGPGWVTWSGQGSREVWGWFEVWGEMRIFGVYENGAWNGPWVSTEVVAAAVGLLVYYFAFSTKSSIQA
ncbi:translocon-associated protein subunit delta [Phasianus colchicus]|uniref:translocon-associated protein subunit delta n=1 Tax=Phasianus colchicus TaxID=9054 RepID=UPI00129D817C|nr:translocon-associated protein subunit delta [Phasianus colchicus]